MPNVFGSALNLETFVLVVVVARFNSWDHFFFNFFFNFQTLDLRFRVTARLALG